VNTDASEMMVMQAWDLIAKQTTTPEGVRAVDEADLVPKGKYEGIVHDDITAQIDDRETFASGTANPMYGKARARLRLELFDPLGGASRGLFVDATGEEIKTAAGRLTEASTIGVMLAKATGTVGGSFAQTLKAATGVRLQFDIGVLPAKGVYKARNRINSITPASTSNGF
jgi:hypothetical protein